MAVATRALPELRARNDLTFSIDIERDGDFWTLRDSRGETETKWRVRAHPLKPTGPHVYFGGL